MDTRIVVGGDVCPIGRNQSFFEREDAEGLLHDLLPEFERAGLTIVNLECPLIERETPIEKCGEHRGVPLNYTKGFRAMGLDVACLGNNHIMDHGTQGLRSTIRALKEAGLAYVGAGENVTEAGQVLRRKVGDANVAIMAVAEHEFSIATRNSPGANPLNLIEYVRTMKGLRGESDCVIVLLHGGPEHYPYPTPELQHICRFMIEEGANFVLCQHSHCGGCYESYQGGYIVYGQGNLLFDLHPQFHGEWNRGFLVRVTIRADKTCEMDLVPYLQSDERPGVRRMNADEEVMFMHEVQARSMRVQDEGFVESAWREFCREKQDSYFSVLRGHGRLVRRANRITHFADRLYSRSALLSLQDIVRCESHREVLLAVLADR